jgi:hypothetical protein
VAELNASTIAYWNGSRLVYCHSTSDDASRADCVIDELRWSQWKSWLVEWLTYPVFCVRDDLRHKPAPPLQRIVKKMLSASRKCRDASRPPQDSAMGNVL